MLDTPALTLLHWPTTEAEAISTVRLIAHGFHLDLTRLGETPADAVPIADAAKARGVAERTIHSWIENGGIRAVRHGLRYLVSLAEVQAYVPRPRGQPRKQRS